MLFAEASQTRQNLRITTELTVAILAQGTSWADAVTQAFLSPCCAKRPQRKVRRRARQKCRELGSAESSPDSQERTRDTQTKTHGVPRAAERSRHTEKMQAFNLLGGQSLDFMSCEHRQHPGMMPCVSLPQHTMILKQCQGCQGRHKFRKPPTIFEIKTTWFC